MKKRKTVKKKYSQEGDGLYNEQIHGITGLRNFLHDKRRRQRIILDYYSYHAAASSIGK
jgi:hypothetical protein